MPAFFYMSRILEMKRRFETLNTDAIIDKTMIESEDTLADLNVQQQIAGINKEGEAITPFYKPITIAIKKQKGQPTDRVTLHDTGDYHAGFYAKVEGESIVFSSTDEKAQSIAEKYENTGGLSEKYRAEAIRETIRPMIKTDLSAHLKLKF